MNLTMIKTMSKFKMDQMMINKGNASKENKLKISVVMVKNAPQVKQAYRNDWRQSMGLDLSPFSKIKADQIRKKLTTGRRMNIK